MNSDHEELVRRLVDAVSSALLLTTVDGTALWHNAAFATLLGDASDQVVAWLNANGVQPDLTPTDLALSHSDATSQVVESAETVAPEPGPTDAMPADQCRWIQVVCRPFEGHLLYEIHEVTELHHARRRLSYLDNHDPLTGLANRRVVNDRLDQLLRDSAAGDPKGGLLLIDIDHFKDINDLHGHAVGDQVMCALARLLHEVLPSTAVLGRLGGDEFAVVLPEGGGAEILGAARRLCRIVAGTPLPASGQVLRITLSVGVAPIDSELDSELLLANADLGLYEAKTAGRNRARLFADEQYRTAVRRINVKRRIRDALDGDRLELDAQPIVDLATGKVTSYELLTRLRDGVYPVVGPADFVPTLERGDLVRVLDRWVVERATEALAQPTAIATGLCLDVNVSSRSMDDPTFGEWVVSRLHDLQIEPARLGLEITETTAISNLGAARLLAETLTTAGCRFSLDDFGAGFGSFVYLKNLPFTTIKIAGDFVRQADAGGVDAVLVGSVVRAATGLGMTTVAEYVDREPLVAALRDLGVNRGQGYHFGRPEPLRLLVAESPEATQRIPHPRTRRDTRSVPAAARGVARNVTQRIS